MGEQQIFAPRFSLNRARRSGVMSLLTPAVERIKDGYVWDRRCLQLPEPPYSNHFREGLDVGDCVNLADAVIFLRRC